jgi:hypothetical protein
MAEQGETARPVYEDELPEMPQAVFDALYAHSWVDGVRLYPSWSLAFVEAASTLTADLARLRTEGEALRGALETFGSHRNGCPAVSVLMSTADPYRFRAAGPNCTCGLGAALAAPRAEEGTGR